MSINLKKTVLKLVVPLIFASSFMLIILIVVAVSAFNQERALLSKKYNEKLKAETINNTGDNLVLTPEVEAYRERVLQEAELYGIADYTNLLLAVMMQESGGKVEDVFQCSESLGLPRNSISTEESIKQGVKVLADYISCAGVESPGDIIHIRLALQAYNFGGGFIEFANEMTGGWSQEATDAYAKKYSGGRKRTGVKAQTMGIWAYGDQYYTDHVLRYYTTGSTAGTTTNSSVVEYALTLLGCPYQYGATGPNCFDCSGFVYYVFKNTGVYTGERTTAANYKNIATPISKEEAQPGDLVFFTNSSGKTHHVGIYIGDGKMIHAPQTGDVVKISLVMREKDTISFGRLSN